MALRGRRIIIIFELWCIVGSGGLEIWVSLTRFQKRNIGWPQQPPIEKVLKSRDIQLQNFQGRNPSNFWVGNLENKWLHKLVQTLSDLRLNFLTHSFFTRNGVIKTNDYDSFVQDENLIKFMLLVLNDVL